MQIKCQVMIIEYINVYLKYIYIRIYIYIYIYIHNYTLGNSYGCAVLLSNETELIKCERRYPVLVLSCYQLCQ